MKYGFDWYLINKWSAIKDFSKDDPDQMLSVRKNACHNFNLALKGKKVADPHTIRKWFGLGGLSKPNRESIFKLAFALSLSVDETQEYLQKGLLVPGIQINDHQEIIWLYGLENHLSYDYCETMIELFEKKLVRELHFVQENHTDRLWTYFQQNKDLAPEEFLLWMTEHASLFKGYSKTALDYFVALKQEIITTIQNEAKREVLFLLKNTDYYEWIEKMEISEKDSPDAIRRYLKNEKRRRHSQLPQELLESLSLHTRIAFGVRGSDSHFLAELYAADSPTAKISGVPLMIHKSLSQILHIAEQKEASIHLMQELACTDEEHERKKLKQKLRSQKQRCRIIHREDLLPLLHYMGQKKYLASIHDNMSEYNREDATQYFIDYANTILAACQMVPISAKYELDALLLDSFKTEDMYLLSELIEEL